MPESIALSLLKPAHTLQYDKIVGSICLVRLTPWLGAGLLAVLQPPLQGQLYVVSETSVTNAPAVSHPVTMVWNPSPDNVIGYFLCWGFASGECTNRLDVGNVSSVTIAGLQTNVTYYFNVIAYGGLDQESAPSNEIAYSVPGAIKYYTGGQSGSGSVGTEAERAFRIVFTGVPGGTYRIEYSESLGPAHWVSLGSFIADAQGRFEYVDSSLSRSASRFYRVAYP
jgi:hypothetical protein